MSSRVLKYFTNGVSVCLSILIGAYLFISFKFLSYGPDTGFYLSYAKDLSLGKNFYTEMSTSYSPLVMWFYSLWFKYFKVESINVLFVINYFIYFLNAFLIFKIGRFFKTNLALRILFALLFLVVIFNLDGMHILLEIYVLLFVLLVTFILLNYQGKLTPMQLVLLGLLSFLAFYCKQYGLLVIPGVVWYLFRIHRTRFLKPVVYYSLGLMIPFIILLIINTMYYNLPLKSFVLRLFGMNQNENLPTTGAGYTISGLRLTLLHYITLFPFLIMVIFVGGDILRIKKVQYLIIVSFIASLSLYFAYYPHYFQLIFPFVILLVMYVVNRHKEYQSLFLVLCMVTVVTLPTELDKIYDYKKNDAKILVVKTEKLNSIAPPGTKVFLFGVSPRYYYACGFKAPNLKELGYAFTNNIPFKEFVPYLDEDAYVISNLKNFKQLGESGYKPTKIVKMNDKLAYALFSKQNNSKNN
jgi:hypothetical protein